MMIEMNDVKSIDIANYDYCLPDERIPRYPVSPRDHSKLLHYHNGVIDTHHFYNLPSLLVGDEMLVYNNTKVIQARMFFEKATGAVIEVFCLEPFMPADYAQMFQSTHSCVWQCLIGNSRRWKEGRVAKTLIVGDKSITLTAQRELVDPNDARASKDSMAQYVRFEWNDDDVTFAQILDCFGQLPIPPYLCRDTEERDKETYQTVYSKYDGSVAAPTAGLHFTDEVLRQIADKGVIEDEVTLHVGAGTFQPVKSDVIGGHPMHRETIEVTRATLVQLIAKIGKIVAVGTTSVRTLESLYYIGVHILRNHEKPNLMVEQWEPYDEDYGDISIEQALQAIVDYIDALGMKSIHAATRIIIVPGFTFKVVNKVITNFHQPRSTLLLLVSAFIGNEACREVYKYALANDYRFLSYGDSSLLEQ